MGTHTSFLLQVLACGQNASYRKGRHCRTSNLNSQENVYYQANAVTCLETISAYKTTSKYKLSAEKKYNNLRVSQETLNTRWRHLLLSLEKEYSNFL